MRVEVSEKGLIAVLPEAGSVVSHNVDLAGDVASDIQVAACPLVHGLQP